MTLEATGRVTFAGTHGMLAGKLERPVGDVRATALFAHCFTCTKDILAASRISRALMAAGFAVLRFDFSGLGESSGDFANTNFSSNLEDLRAAAAFLAAHDMGPELLIGHSLGGAAVLAVAGELEQVRAVATIGAPFEPHHVVEQFGDSIRLIESEGEAEVLLSGRPFRVKLQFLEDIASHDQSERIARLRAGLLVLHAPLDQTVGIENAFRIFTAAKHPKSFVSLDGADHLLRGSRYADYAGRVIAAWASLYLAS